MNGSAQPRSDAPGRVPQIACPTLPAPGPVPRVVCPAAIAPVSHLPARWRCRMQPANQPAMPRVGIIGIGVVPSLHIPMAGYKLNKHEERGHHERHDEQNRGKKPNYLEDLPHHATPLLVIRMPAAKRPNPPTIGGSTRHWRLPKTSIFAANASTAPPQSVASAFDRATRPAGAIWGSQSPAPGPPMARPCQILPNPKYRMRILPRTHRQGGATPAPLNTNRARAWPRQAFSRTSTACRASFAARSGSIWPCSAQTRVRS